jgi:PadR family transcriptional regulator AphA
MSLKHAILGFLSFAPLSGYDLKKAFDQSVRHFWPANQSQIYRTLAELDEQRLVDKEIIPREDRLDMKVYHINETGRAELRRWLSTPLPPQDNREPFLIQIFFGGQLTDAELLNVLQHEVQTVEERLAVFASLYQTTVERPHSQIDQRSFFLSLLTLEYGLAAHRTYRQWLQAAIQRIRSGDYSPAPLSELIGDLE